MSIFNSVLSFHSFSKEKTMSMFMNGLVYGGLGLAAAGFVMPAGAAVVSVSTEAAVNSNAPDADQDEAGLGYLMVKFHGPVTSARHSYFQFDLTGQDADLAAAATFSVIAQNTADQAVQLWALDQAYSGFSAATWNNAQANNTATNDLLTTGTFTATQIGSVIGVDNPGSGQQIDFNLASLAPYMVGDKITLVLTGADDTGSGIVNSSSGLRVRPTESTLTFSQVPEPGSLALLGLGGLLIARRRRA